MRLTGSVSYLYIRKKSYRYYTTKRRTQERSDVPLVNEVVGIRGSKKWLAENPDRKKVKTKENVSAATADSRENNASADSRT